MFSKLTVITCLIFACTVQISCQNKQWVQNPFLEQIKQLEEFKQENKRVDSIKKVSTLPVEFTICVIDSSFLYEDKGKHISLGFINEQYPYGEDRIMYTVKFDKDNQKIISIKKHGEEFKNSDPGLSTEDIPLIIKRLSLKLSTLCRNYNVTS